MVGKNNVDTTIVMTLIMTIFMTLIINVVKNVMILTNSALVKALSSSRILSAD